MVACNVGSLVEYHEEVMSLDREQELEGPDVVRHFLDLLADRRHLLLDADGFCNRIHYVDDAVQIGQDVVHCRPALEDTSEIAVTDILCTGEPSFVPCIQGIPDCLVGKTRALCGFYSGYDGVDHVDDSLVSVHIVPVGSILEEQCVPSHIGDFQLIRGMQRSVPGSENGTRRLQAVFVSADEAADGINRTGHGFLACLSHTGCSESLQLASGIHDVIGTAAYHNCSNSKK